MYMVKQVVYNEIPQLLVLEYPYMNIETSHKIQFVVNGGSATLHLKGIIYYEENHFTCRIISADGQMWYHDGLVNQGACIEDGKLEGTSGDELKKCQGRDLIMAIYVQK